MSDSLDCEICGGSTEVETISIGPDEEVSACRECRIKIFTDSSELQYFTERINIEDSPQIERIKEAISQLDNPFFTISDLSEVIDEPPSLIESKLKLLYEDDEIKFQDVTAEDYVWYSEETPSPQVSTESPVELENEEETTSTQETVDKEPTEKSGEEEEMIVLFPERREVVVKNVNEETKQRLSRFSHLVDKNEGAFMYKIDPADIWNTPHETLEALIEDIRAVLPRPSPHMEDRIESYWEDAHKFTLVTGKEGFSILKAEEKSDIDNIAKRHLEYPEHYTRYVSDTELRLKKGAEGDVKQELYEQGYPVQDWRDLESGKELDVQLEGIELRDYQQEWVERFMERGSGTFVGPSGSGKTIAALGVMQEIDGEVLIIVTSREVASQWSREIVENTNLSKRKVGEYHGGKKQIRPVTIATYDIARMSQHRKLFNKREWGLMVLDECHHVPAPVWKRTTNLQSRYRLGLTATPVRESGNDKEIYSLIGPPVGTDWAKLFESGHVQEPTVEIRYVPWASDTYRERYNRASGHSKRQIAASNPRKLQEINSLIEEYKGKKKLIFVQWIDQGKKYAEELELPFVYGETSHDRREELFDELREGKRDALILSSVGDEGIDLPDAEVAIIASWRGRSRSQGTQRPGRVMRPIGEAQAFFIATKGSNEEDFVRAQTQYMSQKGIRVTETRK